MTNGDLPFLPLFTQPMVDERTWQRRLQDHIDELRSNRKVLAITAASLGSVLLFLVFVISTRKTEINLPSTSFAQVADNWKELRHLIVLPGHAIQWCTDVDKPVTDESCWFLQSFQQGQVPLFLAHIRRAIEEASNDSKSLLIFSGGQTRPGVGLRTEAQSYFNAAEQLGYFQKYGSNNIFDRSISENFARDSLENVMFSICRFKEVVGHYPRKVTVVGFPFKGPRFLELHRKAVNFPVENFKYIGVEVSGYDQTSIVDDAYADFKKDIYGCGKKLFEKRLTRNPYKHVHGYKETCPDMIHYFDACLA